jgi:HD-GYP domain-containing protein (c-di-GMP phosphodiesterase class II)/DNA-binding CsgD family transcriptional regulator
VGASLRLADLLAGLSLVADLGFGLPQGTAVRTCLVASSLARRMDLGESDARDCFYTGLLMHVGCLAVAHEAAAAFGDDLAFNRAVSRTNLADPGDVVRTFLPTMTAGMPSAVAARTEAFVMTEGPAWGRQVDVGVCEVGRETARRLGLPDSTQQALYHAYESWVGGWAPDGLRGEEIAIGSRVARAALEAAVFDQLGGAEAALTALRQRSGVILDPSVVAVFAEDPRGILAEADDGDPRDRVLEVEPGPAVERTEAQLVEVAAAFGDLADTKVPFLHGHSRAVATLATGAARRLGLTDDEVGRIEIAGLLHDVGRVGVSNAVWEKSAPLNRVEWEQVRMHAYFTERILASSRSLAPIATVAGMHHERLDGSGYHRGSEAFALPTAARLLAAADAYAAMTRARPYRPALSDDHAAQELLAEAEAGRLDHDAVAAVLAEAGHHVGRRRTTRPAGLSDREAEVLTLIAAGCSNAEVAARLYISRRTAEHHAQHIYAKIGVSTRAGAALFAVQHGLVNAPEPDRPAG